MIYDPDEGEKFNKAQDKEENQQREELRSLLRTEAGQKHFYEMFRDSFIFTSTFTKSSESFFNEGRRAAALEYFNAILDLDPRIFEGMCTKFRNKGNNV